MLFQDESTFEDAYEPYEDTNNRGKKLAIGLILLGLLIVILAAAYWVLAPRLRLRPPAIFGAIATSQSTLNFGSAWGYGDPDAAAKRSLQECNAHVPNADCVVRLNLQNTCGALAVSESRGQSFVVNDNDKNLAGALALASCQAGGAEDCVLSQNFCGSGN